MERVIGTYEILKSTIFQNTEHPFENVPSFELKVGDFVKLEKGQPAPCDIQILDCCEKYLSHYYVHCESSANDGSTNLLTKKCLNGTKGNSKARKGDFNYYRKKLTGHIEYSYHTTPYQNFEAFIKLRADPKVEIGTIDNLVVKGSILRSDWLIGLVLYVGDECKPSTNCTLLEKLRCNVSMIEIRFNKYTFIIMLIYFFFVQISKLIQSMVINEDAIVHIVDPDTTSNIGVFIYMILYIPYIPLVFSGQLDLFSIFITIKKYDYENSLDTNSICSCLRKKNKGCCKKSRIEMPNETKQTEQNQNQDMDFGQNEIEHICEKADSEEIEDKVPQDSGKDKKDSSRNVAGGEDGFGGDMEFSDQRDDCHIMNGYNFLNFARIHHVMIDKTQTQTTGEIKIKSIFLRERTFCCKTGTVLFNHKHVLPFEEDLFNVNTDSKQQTQYLIRKSGFGSIMNSSKAINIHTDNSLINLHNTCRKTSSPQLQKEECENLVQKNMSRFGSEKIIKDFINEELPPKISPKDSNLSIDKHDNLYQSSSKVLLPKFLDDSSIIEEENEEKMIESQINDQNQNKFNKNTNNNNYTIKEEDNEYSQTASYVKFNNNEKNGFGQQSPSSFKKNLFQKSLMLNTEQNLITPRHLRNSQPNLTKYDGDNRADDSESDISLELEDKVNLQKPIKRSIFKKKTANSPKSQKKIIYTKKDSQNLQRNSLYSKRDSNHTDRNSSPRKSQFENLTREKSPFDFSHSNFPSMSQIGMGDQPLNDESFFLDKNLNSGNKKQNDYEGDYMLNKPEVSYNLEANKTPITYPKQNIIKPIIDNGLQVIIEYDESDYTQPTKKEEQVCYSTPITPIIKEEKTKYRFSPHNIIQKKNTDEDFEFNSLEIFNSTESNNNAKKLSLGFQISKQDSFISQEVKSPYISKFGKKIGPVLPNIQIQPKSIKNHKGDKDPESPSADEESFEMKEDKKKPDQHSSILSKNYSMPEILNISDINKSKLINETYQESNDQQSSLRCFDKEVITLMDSMNLCHNSKISAIEKEFDSDIPEEKAMMEFCKSNGYIGVPKIFRNKEAKARNKRSIVIKAFEQNRKTCSIIGMNMTHSEQDQKLKVSVLVVDCSLKKLGTSTLYVRASPLHFKDRLCEVDRQDLYQKDIFSDIGNRSGFQWMYAKKELGVEQTKKVKSEQNNLQAQLVQDENGLNRYFDDLEKNQSFVGIIDFEETIRRGANEFINNCKLASIKTNIQSGDEKKKCISVGYQTNIIDKDFGIYDLTFDEETEGIAQIKGLLKEVKLYKETSSTKEDRNLLKEFLVLLDRERKKNQQNQIDKSQFFKNSPKLDDNKIKGNKKFNLECQLPRVERSKMSSFVEGSKILSRVEGSRFVGSRFASKKNTLIKSMIHAPRSPTNRKGSIFDGTDKDQTPRLQLNKMEVSNVNPVMKKGFHFNGNQDSRSINKNNKSSLFHQGIHGNENLAKNKEISNCNSFHERVKYTGFSRWDSMKKIKISNNSSNFDNMTHKVNKKSMTPRNEAKKYNNFNNPLNSNQQFDSGRNVPKYDSSINIPQQTNLNSFTDFNNIGCNFVSKRFGMNQSDRIIQNSSPDQKKVSNKTDSGNKISKGVLKLKKYDTQQHWVPESDKPLVNELNYSDSINIESLKGYDSSDMVSNFNRKNSGLNGLNTFNFDGYSNTPSKNFSKNIESQIKGQSSRFVLNNLKQSCCNENFSHINNEVINESEIKEDHKRNSNILTEMMYDPSKRIIVLGSKQFEIIKKSKYLLNHFSLLMNIYGGYICYNFNAQQKREIIEYLKIGPKYSTTCQAIGDGANDVPMMRSADVSVQIARKGYSGIHSDMIVYNFNPINKIIFHKSLILEKNMNMYIYHIMFMSIKMMLVTFAYQQFCAFSAVVPNFIWIISFIDYIKNLVIGSIYIFYENHYPDYKKIQPFFYYKNFKDITPGWVIRKFLLHEIICLTLVSTILGAIMLGTVQDNQGNYLDMTCFRWIVTIYWLKLQFYHIMVAAYKSRLALLIYGYLPQLCVFLAILVIAMCIEMGDHFIPSIIELIYYFKSMEILKFQWYASTSSITIIFIYNMLFYSQSGFYKFIVIHDKINDQYKKDKDREKIFNQLYNPSEDISILVRYYFMDASVIDAILEKIVQPDSTKYKKIKVSKFIPIIDDPEKEMRYRMNRSRGIFDDMFVTAVSGVCFSILLLDIPLEIWNIETWDTVYYEYNLNLHVWYIVASYTQIVFIMVIPRLMYAQKQETQKKSFNKSFYYQVVISIYLWVVSNDEDGISMLYLCLVLFSLALQTKLYKIMINFVCLIFIVTIKVYFRWDIHIEAMIIGNQRNIVIINGNQVKFDKVDIFATIVLLLMLACCGFALILWRIHYEYRSRKGYIYEARTSKSSLAATEQLSMLMPKFVIDRIKSFSSYGLSIADDVGLCTVLFCDIDDFDKLCKGAEKDVVLILDELFRNFDRLCSKYGVQKIETVGKTYMAAGGQKIIEDRLPGYIQEINYTARVIELAREMMKFVSGFNINIEGKIKLKIGIHHGECMMGIIGYHKPQFSLIGDTVNFTSRHCTTGIPCHIMISLEAWEDGNRWDIPYEIVETDMKGKGKVNVYHVYQKNRDLKQCLIESLKRIEDEQKDFNGQLSFPTELTMEEINTLQQLVNYIEVQHYVTMERDQNFGRVIQSLFDHTKNDKESGNIVNKKFVKKHSFASPVRLSNSQSYSDTSRKDSFMNSRRDIVMNFEEQCDSGQFHILNNTRQQNLYSNHSSNGLKLGTDNSIETDKVSRLPIITESSKSRTRLSSKEYGSMKLGVGNSIDINSNRNLQLYDLSPKNADGNVFSKKLTYLKNLGNYTSSSRIIKNQTQNSLESNKEYENSFSGYIQKFNQKSGHLPSEEQSPKDSLSDNDSKDEASTGFNKYAARFSQQPSKFQNKKSQFESLAKFNDTVFSSNKNIIPSQNSCLEEGHQEKQKISELESQKDNNLIININNSVNTNVNKNNVIININNTVSDAVINNNNLTININNNDATIKEDEQPSTEKIDQTPISLRNLYKSKTSNNNSYANSRNILLKKATMSNFKDKEIAKSELLESQTKWIEHAPLGRESNDTIAKHDLENTFKEITLEKTEHNRKNSKAAKKKQKLKEEQEMDEELEEYKDLYHLQIQHPNKFFEVPIFEKRLLKEFYNQILKANKTYKFINFFVRLAIHIIVTVSYGLYLGFNLGETRNTQVIVVILVRSIILVKRIVYLIIYWKNKDNDNIADFFKYEVKMYREDGKESTINCGSFFSPSKKALLIDLLFSTTIISFSAFQIGSFPNHYIYSISFYEIFIDFVFITIVGYLTFKQIIGLSLYAFILQTIFLSIDYGMYAYTKTGDSIFFSTMLYLNQICFFIINILSYKSFQVEFKAFNAKKVGRVKNFEIAQFIDRLLPKHIQENLSNPTRDLGELYKDVTILFADIVGFTAYSSGKKPSEVVNMLSELFMDFDKQCDSSGLYKLYTIGDCYVVLGFLDIEKRKTPEEEAADVLDFAEKLIHLINKVRRKINFMDLDMRIGIHTVIFFIIKQTRVTFMVELLELIS